MSDTAPSDCPLSPGADDPDQRLVCRNDSTLFLQNSGEQGALVGSGVIIPIRHAHRVRSDPRRGIRLISVVEAGEALDGRDVQPHGYNVGWNCGTVGGQTVMHAHMHVIPRFAQEPYAGRGIRCWLKQDANRWQ